MANDRFLEENEGKMEEIGEYKQGWENFEERSNLNIILLIFREKKNILEILKIPDIP